MHALMIALRLLHILSGVFWAGTLFFIVTFLEPSVRAAGPEGGRVMQRLQQRHYLDIMPVIAGLTILSGLALYWRVSVGFSVEWVTSPLGLSFTVGGLAAIVAFVVGVFVMRAAALRAGALGQSLEQLTQGPAREAQLAQVQALRRRAATSARWVAALLAIGVIGMAVARYL